MTKLFTELKIYLFKYHSSWLVCLKQFTLYRK